MEKITLEYRSVAKTIYKTALWGCLLAEIIILRLKLPEVLTESWYSALLILVLASTVPLSVIIRCFFFLRPRIFSTYELSDTGIVKNFGKKSESHRFEDITDIKISKLSPRFFGGFTLTFKSGQKMTFLSLLKGNEKILERSGWSGISEEEIHRYSLTSQKVDVSWKRIKEKFSNWKMVCAKYLAAPVVLTAVVQNQFPDLLGELSTLERTFWYFLVVFVLSTGLALGLNHAEERIVLGKMGENLERDLAFEKRVSVGVEFLFYALVVFLVLSLMSL